MTTWGDRIGVFDLETTGVDVDTSRVVSACIAIVDAEGSVVSRWNWLADPGIPIPDGASAVHGITTEYAHREGRPAELVIAEIVQTLRVLFATGIPVTVYNAPYDLTLLDRECRRHHLEPIEAPFPVIDPLVIDKALDRFRKGKRTLEVTAELYGVALEDAHDAGADAVAAGRVALALLRRYPDDLEIALADLHGRQVQWHAEQAASFQEYLRKKRGDDSYVADPSWPFKPTEDSSSFVDTQPIPPLPPRLGNVPVFDFSATAVLELEVSRGDALEPARRGFNSEVYRRAPRPRLVDRVDHSISTESGEAGAPESRAPESGAAEAAGAEPTVAELVESFPPQKLAAADTDDTQVVTLPPAVLRVAAAIITDSEGRCLLVRKAGTSAFMQAGGKLEPGESAVDALARELDEELGLELDDSAAEYLGVFRADAPNEPNTVVSAAVFAFETPAEVAPRGEIEELLWVDSLDAIEVELAPLTRDELLPLWAARRASSTLF